MVGRLPVRACPTRSGLLLFVGAPMMLALEPRVLRREWIRRLPLGGARQLPAPSARLALLAQLARHDDLRRAARAGALCLGPRPRAARAASIAYERTLSVPVLHAADGEPRGGRAGLAGSAGRQDRVDQPPHRRARHRSRFLAGRSLVGALCDRRDQRLVLDGLLHDHLLGRPAGHSQGVLRGREDRRRRADRVLLSDHAAALAADQLFRGAGLHGHRGLRLPDLRPDLRHDQRRPGQLDCARHLLHLPASFRVQRIWLRRGDGVVAGARAGGDDRALVPAHAWRALQPCR